MYEKIILKNLVEEWKKVNLEKVLKLLQYGIIHNDQIDKKILYNGLFNIIKDKEIKELNKLKKNIFLKKRQSLF